MKVAIVTENFLPKVDGVTRTLARLLAHLQEQGHEAILLGPNTGMDKYCGHELIGTFGVPFPPYPEIKLNFFRPLFLSKLLSFQPDVIHYVDPVWIGPQIMYAAKTYMPDTPCVSSYHTNLATYCELFGYSFLVNTMWRWNRYLHNKCAVTACPSNSTAAVLQEHGFNNTRIWPRGVDLTSLNPQQRDEALRQSWLGDQDQASTTVIMYVGRISYEKNLKLLVGAYKLLRHDNIHLVLVGHGPAQAEIARELKGYNVTFTGHLSGQALSAAYASADIFAFPSFTETFGQVVLEALASGVPVVGLLSEGVRDLVVHEKTGLLLDFDLNKLDTDNVASSKTKIPDPKPLIQPYAALLSRLIQDTSLRAKMASAAAESAKGRTWADAMERMVDSYRQAIAIKVESVKQSHLPSPALPPRQDISLDLRLRTNRLDLNATNLPTSRQQDQDPGYARFSQWLLGNAGKPPNRASAMPPWTRTYMNYNLPNELAFKLLVLLYGIYLLVWAVRYVW